MLGCERRAHRTWRHIAVIGLLTLAVFTSACAGGNGEGITPIPTATQPTATTSIGSPAAGSPGTSAPNASPTIATATTTVAATPSVTISIPPGEPAVYGYRIVNTYPHDPTAFTQGLDIADGVLYEGTGLNGKSSLRRVDLETGEVLQQIDIDEQYFGEGIVVFGDSIVQITWQSQLAFVYDRETFELIETHAYPTQGWGLTTDGERLIMSDGSNTIIFRDFETFAEMRRIEVMDGDEPVIRLNELEWVNGEIWANVWQTDTIARIDPATGAVIGWIDLNGLLRPEDQAGATVDVLNGIAVDETTGRIFVTGKLWPVLYEIELVAP